MEIFGLQPLDANPMISKAKVKIAYDGFNRNGSHISKETMELMIRRSLALTPIVGYYLKDKKDFGDHNTMLEMDDNYNLVTVRGTNVYGAVPEHPVVYWQKFADEDGELRDYVVSDVYLWTERFPEVKRVLDGKNNHSMEIDEKSVIGEWDEKANNGAGAFIIKEANFSALCILGADIEPCFEGAGFSSDFAFKKEKIEYEKEMGDFMSKLEFALQHNFDDSKVKSTSNDNVELTIANVDTEEEIEDIKDAVDKLDLAAETEVSPETQEAIDSAIDTLLQVEVELDIEDQIIPITDEAKEVVGEMVGGMKDILSNPTYEKVDPINTPFKEEEVEMAKTPEELLAEQEAAKLAAQTQEPAAAVVPPAEPQVAAPVAPAVPGEPQQVTVEVEDDTPAPAVIDPVTGLPVEQPRKTADEKRKEIELAKFDDEELLEILISRMETADTMRERITQLVQGAEQVMEENPELVPGEEGEAPVPGEEDEDEFARKPEDEENPAAPPANTEEQPVPAKEDAAPEAPAKEEPAVPAKEEAPAAPAPALTPEEEEERKKKKQIQSYDLDESAKMAKDLFELNTKFQALEDEAKSLREFKANIDNQEKEEVLSVFSLLDDEFKTKLRSEFSLLSKEDIESKCALAYFRKGLMNSGQNTQASDAVISYNLEGETSSLPGWVSAIKTAKRS